MSAQTNEEKIRRAEELASRWLGDGNQAAEQGKKEKSEQYYAKAQYWLDRANKLRRW